MTEGGRDFPDERSLRVSQPSKRFASRSQYERSDLREQESDGTGCRS